MKKIAIFGLGVVGGATLEQLKNKKDYQICGIFSRSFKESAKEFLWFDCWKKLVDECDIVVETIGGVDIASEIIFYALQKNKQVVTANKYFLATFGANLLPKYNQQLRFEAAVCASIPIVKLLRDYYKKERISEISGILNGTSNYILSKVAQGLSFDFALKNAQQLGFAESDPTFDIEGFDAAHKAIILHYILFNKWLKVSEVEIEAAKFAKAGEKNIAIIKHDKVAIKNIADERFTQILENNNAIKINCQTTGETFISGIGAGGKETAFAVARDIEDFC